MNLLYIAEHDPSLAASGVQQRTQLIHRLFEERASVYTLVIDWIPHPPIYDEQHKVLHYCFVKRFSIKWFWEGILGRIFPHIKIPYFNHINSVCKNFWPDVKFDVVITRYISNAAYTTAWQVAPLVIDVDDIPSKCLSGSRSFKGKVFSLWEWRATYIWERKIAEHALALLLPDKKQFSHFQNCKCFYFPNIPILCMETSMFSGLPTQFIPRTSNYMLSVGTLSHLPNALGIDFFLNNYWPELHERFPLITYKIVGKGLPPRFADKWSKIQGVEILGFVDDLESLYLRCLCCVAPIYSGSGTCIKVAEALSHGCDCLCTIEATRGIDEEKITKDNGIWVFNNAIDFQNYLQEIIDRSDADLIRSRHRIHEFAQKMWNIENLRIEIADVLKYLSKAIPSLRF